MNKKQLRDEKIVKTLIEIGIPKDVVHFAVSNKIENRFFKYASTLDIPLFLFASMIILSGTPNLGEKLTRASALTDADSTQMLLLRTDFSISTVIAIFSSLGLASLLTYLLSASDKWAITAFVYGNLNPEDIEFPVHIYSGDNMAYIRKAQKSKHLKSAIFGRNSALIGGILLVIAAVTFLFEIKSFDLAYADSFQRAGALPWSSNFELPYSDVQFVELGCTHRRKGSLSGYRSDVIYNLTFSRGRKVNIGNMKAVSGHWLEGLATIDKTLIDMNSDFQRLDGEQPMHKTCLKNISADMDISQRKIFKDILMIGEFPDDPEF